MSIRRRLDRLEENTPANLMALVWWQNFKEEGRNTAALDMGELSNEQLEAIVSDAPDGGASLEAMTDEQLEQVAAGKDVQSRKSRASD